MNATPEVCVTLSTDLLRQLRSRASELELPLEWLVAGLVCDTLDNFTEAAHARTRSRS